MATFTTVVSSTSMNVASMTAMVTIQGFTAMDDFPACATRSLGSGEGKESVIGRHTTRAGRFVTRITQPG